MLENDQVILEDVAIETSNVFCLSDDPEIHVDLSSDRQLLQTFKLNHVWNNEFRVKDLCSLA